MDFPNLKFSIFGGWPFHVAVSNYIGKSFLLQDMASMTRMKVQRGFIKMFSRTPLFVFLAHNWPTGSNVDDICGSDWVFRAGDHGDPDLANAISLLKETTKLSVPLVFGHMHKQLAYGNSLQKMIAVGYNNTVYLNEAIVPRVKRLDNEPGAHARSSIFSETSVEISDSRGTIRAFTTADILDGSIGRGEKIAETWVSVIRDKKTLE